MNVLKENYLSISYKVIYAVAVLYFVGIALLPWSKMYIFSENRSDYYAEWRSFTKSTADTIIRLCNEDSSRFFVIARDDRVSGFIWHELRMDCPIVRSTEVTPLSPQFLQKCNVVLVYETAEYEPDRVLIARGRSSSGTLTKDFTIYRGCTPS